MEKKKENIMPGMPRSIIGSSTLTKRFPELCSAVEHRSTAPAVAVSTGILSLDYALGGGLISGATEIFGEESVGKTTLAGSILAQAIRSGKTAILCASEAFDSDYMDKLGVDLKKLWLARAGSLENLLEATSDSLLSPNSVVVLDSATSFRPEDDIGGKWRDTICYFLERLVIPLDSCLVMINQVRAKRSADHRKMFARGTESACRNTLGKFSTRLELKREGVSEEGYDMLIHMITNMITKPAAVLKVPVTKGTGIDISKDLLRVCVELGLVTQKGSYYYFGDGELFGQGEEYVSRQMDQGLFAREYLYEEAKKMIRARYVA
jgi:recombination protein RecA